VEIGTMPAQSALQNDLSVSVAIIHFEGRRELVISYDLSTTHG